MANAKNNAAAGAIPAADSKDNNDKNELPVKVKLMQPFEYDGKTYSEIDVSGLLELTAGQLCEIDRKMLQLGYTGYRPEMTRQYALFATAKANNMPDDWLYGLKGRDSARLREIVALYFFMQS